METQIDINVDIKNAPIEIAIGNNSYYTNVEQNGIDVSLGRVIIRSVSYSEYEVLNSLGDILFSGRIESGQTASIIAPDAYYYLRNSDNDFVLSGQIPSQTTEYISLSDSYYILFNSEGAFIGSGSTLYGQTSLITAPNASYTLVNSSGDTLSSSTIVSNGFQEIFAPNATYILVDNEGSFITSGQTASGRESVVEVGIEVLIRKYDLADYISYQGYAPVDSGEDDSVWTITKITSNEIGEVLSIEVFEDVKWSERYLL